MKIKLLISALLFLIGCGGTADNLSETHLAPDFSLQDRNGNTFTLSEYRDVSPVVIYFYPKAGTPGCTKQACGIRDDYSKYKESNVTVIGISVDSKSAIQEFIKQNNLNFPLLSDENKKVSELFGVLNNLNLSSRITFIIDKKGIIAKIIRDVDVETHSSDVLEFAKRLN